MTTWWFTKLQAQANESNTSHRCMGRGNAESVLRHLEVVKSVRLTVVNDVCVQLLGNQQMFGRIQEENCGSVSLSLRHDSELSLLTVRLVRAHELLPREGQCGMDPYCRLRLLPDRRHQLHSKVSVLLLDIAR